MDHKIILLVEDNPDDQTLALRALKKNNVLNEVLVAGDGAAALDYLFGTGAYGGHDLNTMPQGPLVFAWKLQLESIQIEQFLCSGERSNPALPCVQVLSAIFMIWMI